MTIVQAIARQFALAGAVKVIITGRDQEALNSAKADIEKEAPGCTVIGVAADVAKEEDAAIVFAALAGAVADVLVNNVGVNSSAVLIADSDPIAWWKDWEVNVKGTYLMTRAYLRSLEGRPGTIINVTTSVADMAVPNMSAYGSSKLAINRLTQIVNAEYGAPQGVRCVCFHPGGVASTDMGQQAPAQFRGSLLCTADLGGGTALYLSTPEAAFLDGRMVYADWNMERVEAMKEEIIRENLLVSQINFGSALSTEIVGLPKK